MIRVVQTDVPTLHMALCGFVYVMQGQVLPPLLHLYQSWKLQHLLRANDLSSKMVNGGLTCFLRGQRMSIVKCED